MTSLNPLPDRSRDGFWTRWKLARLLDPEHGQRCWAYGGTLPDGRVRCCGKLRWHTDSHTFEVESGNPLAHGRGTR